jgi:hypothetical protein
MLFLHRAWFERAWVVQETILANRLVLLCGSTLIRWDFLPIALSFLSQAKMVKQLDDLGSWALRRGPVFKLTRRQHEAGMVVFPPPMDKRHLPTVELPTGGLSARISFVSGIQELRRIVRYNLVMFAAGEPLPTEDWDKHYVTFDEVGLYYLRTTEEDGAVVLWT